MFRPVPMVHLQVQVPSRDGPAVTRRIATQGLLHLVDIGHGTTGAHRPASTRPEVLASFRELARSIHQLARVLDVPLPDLRSDLPAADITDFAVELEEVRERYEPMRATAAEITTRLETARETAAQTHDELEHLQQLTAAGIQPERIRGLRFAHARIGAAAVADLSALAESLAPAAFAILPLAGSAARQVVAVAAPASDREALDTALRAVNFESLDGRAADGDPARLQQQIEAAAQAEASARKELTALKDANGQDLRALAHRVDLAVVLLQAQTFFAAAGRFLVISGWIPEEQAPELTAAIARVTEGRAVVSVERPDVLPAASASALGIPILYRNPVLLRPFQQLVELYGTPSYSELQPTAFFAVSFLLMFGLMFGDVGHGLILVSAGYCLFRYMPRFLDYGILLMEAGAASALFGVLYGSVFGVERWLPALWLRPMHDLPLFTRVAAVLGIVMVSAGFVLGVVNAWRAGDRAAALTSVRGLFGAFAYWTVIAVVARMMLPVEWTVPAGLIWTCVAMAGGLLLMRPLIVKLLAPPSAVRRREHAVPWWLTALEGSIELVDAIVSYFANTISFVRIAAFAAVHAAVLVAVFAIADTLTHVRFGGWLSVGVLIAGNVLTILLEGLTVTVQALRLEYYEFFGKFFRGGGEPYRPLMLRDGDARGDA